MMIRGLIALLIMLPCQSGVTCALCAGFADCADEAGIPGSGVSNGIAFADYDGDGDLDVYVSADPHDILYRNKGDGTFEDVTAAAGIFVRGDGVGAVFGDYDNDGDLDLYIPVNDGWDVFFQNEGNGTFRNVSRLARISNPNRARGATFADFDNDGFLDIYVVNEDAANILYRNKNGQAFEDVAQITNVAHRGTGMSSVWGDYDNDGDLDLYVANKGRPNVLYRNDGIGFRNVTEDAGVEGLGNSTGSAFADYDNDGNLDLCVDGDEIFLYHNNGDGTFTNKAREAGVAHSGEMNTPAFGDYDNDGDLDLYLAAWKGKAVMYLNNGDGTFEDITEEAELEATGNSWSASLSDYDGDGDLDIYASYTTGPNVLYQNNGSGNNWLHIKLLGASSNRDGIGARVELSAGGVLQIREVSGGSGYGSQDSLPVEFGLGKNTVADVAEVRWPSGTVTKLANVRANQMLLVDENFWSVESFDSPNQKPEIDVSGAKHQKPGISQLLPNYPNPFNPETWLPYQLAEQAEVTITIYDVSGRLVRTLPLGVRGQGSYLSKTEAAYWDGKNDCGELMTTGVYFYRLKAGGVIQIRKMVLER